MKKKNPSPPASDAGSGSGSEGSDKFGSDDDDF